ncbi:MAG: DUF5667 domain-containing protein, partial [Candidatus Moraniibacteriota bacterium]
MDGNEEQLNVGNGEREAFVLLRTKTLSEEEKDVMWQTLQVSIRQLHSKTLLQKEFQVTGVLALFMRRSFALSAFSIVIILGGGLGVARAAESALPGQTLYPVKINVNEPIIGSFKFSDTDRAQWERERAGRRIAEAEALAETENLGTAEAAIIEDHLSQNRKKIEQIEGRSITDDEFFPDQISRETNKINVSVE